MATDIKIKDPTNVDTAVNPDVEVNTSKRRITNLLPSVNQTETITKFFDATIDHLFQPADFKKISGYFGRKPFYWDTSREFYLNEPTQLRNDYQLEPAAISKNTVGDITNILFYDDLINHLRFQGGLVSNHNRLFEQEYYSWSPPVDLDKLTAFWNYFWLPEGPNVIEITDLTDVENDLIGRQYPDMSDPVFGKLGVASASSGLRILLTNDATISRNNKIYIIEGVGRNIMLVEDSNVAAAPWDSPPGPAWDTADWDQGGANLKTPDYIVMERGALDNNQWSIGNRWFHKDILTQSNTTLLTDVSAVQAARPIIEYTRNLELYKFSSADLGSVDLIYEGTDIFSHLNNYNVWVPGNYTDPSSMPPTDWINGQHGLVIIPTYIDSSGVSRTDIDGFTLLRDGMRILVTTDSNPLVNNKIYEISGIRLTGLVNLIEAGVLPTNGSQVNIKYGSKFKNSLFIFNGISWEEGQRKISVNQPPLFQLYDVNQTKLDDQGVYQNSTFAGNKIFNFKQSSNGVNDPILGFPLSYDDYGEILYENFIVTAKYSTVINSTINNIEGYYFYKIDGDNARFSNGWSQINVKTQQYILVEQYFDYSNYPNKIPKAYIPIPTLPGVQESGGLPTIIVNRDGNRIQEGDGYIILPEFNDPKENYVGPAIVIPGPINEEPTSFFIQIQLFNKDYTPDDYVRWEIPLNLQANPNNLEVEVLGAGQYFDHFEEIINNQENLEGIAFGVNNWRDTPQDRTLGRQIMQHRAPLLKLMILGSTDNLDFMLATMYAEREYIRTKNKLIQKFNQYRLNSAYFVETPENWVSSAIKDINIGKNNTFPFYYSGMISEGTCIPSTPSRLGIYGTYKPEAYLDDTFIVPTYTIRGHDGSQFIMFGDINGGGPTSSPTDLNDPRDAAYLELEIQIYNSIPTGYKTEELTDFNYQSFVPGKFRPTDYTREEFLKITQPMFERWVSVKGIDYRENGEWSPDNKFTWNYSSSLDVDGKVVPGNWRGLYIWYFDTDRPHTHPWEMLGFSEQPNWWITEYGPAPWTGGNTLMWQDLENGYVRQGIRQGTDSNYARPGLLHFIPVSASGELLDPVSAGIIPQNPTYEQATADWVYGDIGPVENVWVKSEYYPFAIAEAMYLMKPARFIELGWDPDRWDYKFENTPEFQWLNTELNTRPSNSELNVHAEKLNDGTIYIGSGIQQWISDWVISRGQSVNSMFGDVIRGLNVQLAHKMGGFTDSTNLRLLTDNFGLVPSEDITVDSYLSPSIKESIYSGVIIEWSGNGWSVFGYDVLNPVFNTIPGDLSGRKIWIKVGEPEIDLPDLWKSITSYTFGDRVRYQGIIYEATEEHTSTSIFQRDKWKYIGTEAPSTGIRVQEYLDPNLDNDVSQIPYGTVFKTQQDVYSFLIDYERWLESEGWLFEEIDNVTNDTLNWRRSGKEFLNWSLNSWSTGSFIAVSPAATKVKFTSSHGVIQSVERVIRGVYPLLDKSGVKINPNDTTVTRYADTITVTPENNNQGIYACRVSIKEFEHILTVSNITIFNDLIYDVLYNVRQPRFVINGILTKMWRGRIDAPGFIVSDDRIYSNFEKQ
ncbi:MAG: hypothetical protein HC836_10790 [Richelia sp. RM2_1_2]|nr:hypothetical protein [Richelia sp. RM2_1_2]